MAEQGTEKWLGKRAGKVTGSNVGAVLGVHPQVPKVKYWRLLTGREKEDDSNAPWFVWGHNHEPRAIAFYEEQVGHIVKPATFQELPGCDWFGASPDGFVGENRVVEAKCPYSRKVPATIPPHYYAQMQAEMACSGRDLCDFIVWTPGIKAIWQNIKFNPSLWDTLFRLCEYFWKHNVLDDISPGRINSQEKKTAIIMLDSDSGQYQPEYFDDDF